MRTMTERPDFATHPHDEFWTNGTSVICNGPDGEPCLLAECCSEHTAEGIVAVLRYHNSVATQFCYGPRKLEPKVVR